MDPVSIVGLVGTAVGLIRTTAEIVKNLHDLKVKYNNTGSTLQNITQECITLETAITLIKIWIEDNLAQASEGQQKRVLPLNKALIEFTVSIKPLDEEISNMLSRIRPSGALPHSVRFQAVWNERRMKDHLDTLRWQANAIQLLLVATMLPPQESARKMGDLARELPKFETEASKTTQPGRSTERNLSSTVEAAYQILLDDAVCLKKLTRYEAYTIRKRLPDTPNEKPTWAKAIITHESWYPDEIIEQITRVNAESSSSVKEKKQALAAKQQAQVDSILDRLKREELDPNFVWSLQQLESEKRTIGKIPKDRRTLKEKTLKETTSITVYFKRTPPLHVNPRELLLAIERRESEKVIQ